ncbi:MAG: hypothetical protein LBI57_04860 [Helicobacteraceae bacterium]|jgi:hypothetical protein|nr:hypothetical protein [Helicobacteraceae bacterium]
MMKSIVLHALFAAIAFACSGDCVSCHAALGDSLGKDSDHSTLLSCVECHQEIASPNAECGGNCFSCHSENSMDKSVLEHKTLSDCKTCHISAADGNVLGKFLNLGETLEDKLNRAIEPLK